MNASKLIAYTLAYFGGPHVASTICISLITIYKFVVENIFRLFIANYICGKLLDFEIHLVFDSFKQCWMFTWYILKM